MSEYLLTLLTFALAFGALAVSYNLSVGFVSLLSVSHAPFFSMGAYAYGILATADSGSVGAFIGGIVIPLLLAALQELSLATNAAAAVQQIVFGVAMTAMIVFRPAGLFPERRLLARLARSA